MIRVRGHEIDVNIYEELEPYLDRFNQYRVRGDKLQSCSVFRDETTPSFAVNLENGTWIDSGAIEEHNRKGNFIALLATLREEDYSDTASYLIEKYTYLLADTDGLTLELKLEERQAVFNAEQYEKQLNTESPYLSSRRISKKVQDVFKTAENKGKILLPHFDALGRLINVKYRSTKDKQFWYAKDGESIKNYVYGLHILKRVKTDYVLLVESEIDCLFAWSCNIPAVAFSGASLSESQKIELLLHSGVKEVVIATDNDGAGRRFKETLIYELASHFLITEIRADAKDINELSEGELKQAVHHRQAVSVFSF